MSDAASAAATSDKKSISVTSRKRSSTSSRNSDTKRNKPVSNKHKCVTNDTSILELEHILVNEEEVSIVTDSGIDKTISSSLIVDKSPINITNELDRIDDQCESILNGSSAIDSQFTEFPLTCGQKLGSDFQEHYKTLVCEENIGADTDNSDNAESRSEHSTNSQPPVLCFRTPTVTTNRCSESSVLPMNTANKKQKTKITKDTERAAHRALLTSVDVSPISRHRSVVRDRKQKTLLEMPLVPAPTAAGAVNENEKVSSMLATLRGNMKTVTLMMILQSLKYLFDDTALDRALVAISSTSAPSTVTLCDVTKTVIIQFLEAALQTLQAMPGHRYLQHCPIIDSDPIWFTTCCGIAIQRNVTLWLNNLMCATDKAVSSVTPGTNYRSTHCATTTSKGSATSIYSTTVCGRAGDAAVPDLTGTDDQTITGGLIRHAMSTRKTGISSSHIFVQDGTQSYKYELANTFGDTLLDIRIYPTTAIACVDPKDWWHHSLVRGQIVVNSSKATTTTSNVQDRPADPIYLRTKRLIEEIQRFFASAPDTKINAFRSRKFSQ